MAINNGAGVTVYYVLNILPEFLLYNTVFVGAGGYMKT